MLSKILNKYSKIEHIIKVITPKDIYEYNSIKENLENLKSINGIHEIIEENNKIYIVIENNQEAISEIDKLILEKQGILSEKGNREFETNSLIPEEIPSIPPITQVFTEPIIDQGLKSPLDTNSLPEATTNILTENTYISPDTESIFTSQQNLNSFILQDKPSFTPTPEILPIPINGQQTDVISPTSYVEQISIMPPTSSIEPISIDLPTSNIEPISNIPPTSGIEPMPVTPNINVEQTPVVPTSSAKQMSVIPTSTVKQISIFTNKKEPIIPPPIVAASPLLPVASPCRKPKYISLSSTKTRKNSASPKNRNTRTFIHIKPSHRRTISYTMDKDFQRIRPIYNEVNKFNKFTEERYRGFRLGPKFD